MTCNLILAADQFLVDYETKIVSAINILDDFRSLTFPFVRPISVLISLKRGEQDGLETEATLEILLNGKVLLGQKFPIKFSEGYHNTKNISKIGALVITSPGELIFQALERGSVLSKVTVTVYGATDEILPMIVEGPKPFK
jgi:hypothetical protein